MGYGSEIKLKAIYCSFQIGKHHLVAVYTFQIPISKCIDNLISSQFLANKVIL